MPKRIAYLGPEGTYTEEAALRYDPLADLQPFPTIAAVGLAVSSGITEEGVVPIENSLEGSVTYTLDLLIGQSGLSICGELELRIGHYLMVSEDTEPGDVEVIYSHPQALAQCRVFLEREFPGVQQVASLSTAAAADEATASTVPAAAIASKRVANLLSMRLIGRDIQDNPNNATRFVVLGQKDSKPTGDDKTSVWFGLQDKPGSLYNALGVFRNRGLNLSKIESRPTKDLLGTYLFWVDIDGHRLDGVMQEAFEALRECAEPVRVLGSYPRWRKYKRREVWANGTPSEVQVQN